MVYMTAFLHLKGIEIHQSLLADWPFKLFVFSSEVPSDENKTMSIIFLKFAREIFAKFVQGWRMAAFRLPILSSLRGPQPAAFSVSKTWGPGRVRVQVRVQGRGHFFIFF